jgi:hypothetical protein
METRRRDFILRTLFGGGLVGLRALATGLPLSFLLERKVRADSGSSSGCQIDPMKMQYMILATSGAGDPANNNAPGTYDYPDIIHPADPSMAATSIKLGSTQTTAAQIWSTLPQSVLDRTLFFHHGTYTNSHPNHTKVLRLMGGTASNEYLPSIYAKALAPCLGTVQVEPLSVGAGNILAFNGRALPNLKPSALKDILTHSTTPLGKLATLRDRSLDKLNMVLKGSGTPEQLAFLDNMATSHQQARGLSDSLLGALSNLHDDGPDSQVTAAITMIRMNVSPVCAINIPFGGDNHADPNLLTKEVPQHATGIASIASMMTQLQAAGLQDRVTFMMLNVFGRTLKNQGLTGRNHWANHHATLLIGKNVNAGVIGGVIPQGNDYQASPIDSSSGRASMTGDIDFTSTFGAMAKTAGRALGVPQDVLDAGILTGKVIETALL